MNIDYFYDLKLKCPFCKVDATYKLKYSTHLEVLCHDQCVYDKNYTSVFLKAGDMSDVTYCSFFIYTNGSNGFRFISDNSKADNMINLEEKDILNLLNDYSVNWNIKKIQEKYETLMLFK